MIVVVDYDTGNLGSIINMVRKFTKEIVASSDYDVIAKADKLILAGVGAFDNAIQNLEKLNIINLLTQKVIKDKVPILGICLGMQIFTAKSEEGTLKGLNWIDGETVKFRFENNRNKQKVPHMGWNLVKQVRVSRLLENMEPNSRFYFAHSYYVRCNDENNIILITNYGINFPAAIQKDNIFGVQFHPEKSHKYGLQLMKNFVKL